MTALPPQRARRRFDRARAVARALTALVTLLGLVGGVPVLLLRFGHWPITGVPTWEQIKDLPTTIVSDEAIPTVLAVAPWLTWALFVGCVVAEGVAQLRGRSRSALRFGGPLQRAAGYLVGSLVMSIGPLATPGAMAMGVLPSAPPVAAAELPPGGPGANQALATDLVATSTAAAGPGTPSARAAAPGLDDTVPSAEARTALAALGGGQPADDDPRGPGAGAGAAAAQDAAPVTITVRHGDSPWSLAAGHLGDGTRWREIWELNRGRPQPGGDAWVDPEAPIEPGWRLALPADARGARVQGAAASGASPADTATAGDAPATDLTVAPGDNFWSLAEAELTDEWGRAPTDAEVAGYWTTLIDENRDRLLPPHDPDLIYPGQAFVVPATPADPTAPPSPPEPTTPPPDSDASGGTAHPPTGDATGEVGDEAGATGDHAQDQDTAGHEAPDQATPEAETPGDEAPDEMAPEAGTSEDPTEDPAGAYPGQAPAGGAQPGDGSVGDASEAGAYPGEMPGTTDVSPGLGRPDGGTREDAGDVGASPPTADPPAGSARGGEGPTTAGDGKGDGATPGAATPGGAPNRAAGASAADSGERQDDGSILPAGLIAGGVALAGTVLLLDRRRRAQQRHRQAGRWIAMPPPSLERSESVLRHGADIDGARHLEVALRAAAAGSGAAGLPPLRWVEVQESDVLLVLAAPSPPPPGFIALDDERWITSGSFDELESIAAHSELPAPTLMPVGTTADDAELLIELESSGVITVVGSPEETTGLLRSIALAAATAPWSEQSRVLFVGLHGELLDLPWVASVETMAEALVEAEAHVERTTSALWSVRCQSTGQARASGITPEAWAPLVVVSTVVPSDLGERQRLATLANRPRSGAAIVVPSIPGTAPIGRALRVGEDGWLRIDGVEVEVQPDHLDENDASQVVALLDVAKRYGDVAPGPRRQSPRGGRADVPAPTPPPPPPPPPPGAGIPEPGMPEPVVGEPATHGADVHGVAPVRGAAPRPAFALGPLPAPEAPRRLADLLAEADVLVRVLGEVEAVRLTGDTEERLQPVRQKGLETIVYMAVREAPVDREELEIKLFPDGANAAKTVYNTISAARSLVGEDLFPAPSDGRYALDDRIVTDYALFCDLVAEAEDTDDPDVAVALLSDALALVRNEPFMGVGRNYAWVGAHRGIIVAQVIDAAEELAEIHLARNDWRSAEWATRRGLRSFPADERMHRLLMRTARAAGNIPGVQRVFRELCEVIADPDLGVEPEDTLHPETIALLEELTGSSPRRSQMGA